MTENIVVLKKVNKSYQSGAVKVKALQDINICIKKGQLVAIVGTSGSGKTTLLNLVGGLDTPTSGKIWVNNQEISSMNEEERTLFRRKNIGIIFQDYNLVPILNVYENIILPLELERKKIKEEYIDKILEGLHILDKKDCLVSQLSGGQQQRVAVARAILMKPAIILADEPTGNLDTKTSSEVVNLLQIASKKLGQTVIMITHNDKIAQMCNYIIRIEDGKVIYDGGVSNEE
ncbi:ABC transporter, ATP-binding protein [Lachnospiraceae bacterium KM106-2]|nr:ABC transporter, ATP-binding protein [Lachnospiraceae bacterium KM106-2]